MALFFRPGPLQATIGGPFLALLMDDLGAFSRDLGASSPSFPMDVHLFTVPGWWFGCHCLDFPINFGFLIIPIDERIFFRGVAQPPTRYKWVFP